MGTAGGFGVQLALMRLASGYVGEILPDPGWLTWLVGPLASLVLLAGLALPPLMGIRDVPPAAVLRDELEPTRQGVLAPLLALVALLAWPPGKWATWRWRAGCWLACWAFRRRRRAGAGRGLPDAVRRAAAEWAGASASPIRAPALAGGDPDRVPCRWA